ncbi:ABC transporter permease [Clostridium sp. SHJSY1]|uniref:ABC transporter permease n=1 Tax=Clostridium sp. SHJSY1 TaxID=2942483 RepID=UPI002875FDD9|nr:FtsX-like permease family protein [Clostridium sp. SHJSY1]MDS0524458.1 ABC transporter permease [Clostridium sp. SHJSY1]
MYSKLSYRNMKRSFKDYTVYFLTLIFSICLFYVFNSIDAQKVMLDINESQKSAFKMVSFFMGIASVFITFILAFLIIYANNYLIKRRKKELGIYMVLGMDKNRISKILFVETLFIGVISLVLGLILGIFASQGLSLLTAKMFEVDLISFKFIFSSSACIKAILYFGIIYILVGIFNTVSIRKIRLINLLNASKKNETLKVKHLYLSVILFIISVICIGTGYYIIIKYGIAELDNKVLISIILGSVGTLLLFMSLSGFLLKLIQNSKKIYLKQLNMFLLRQINSKINTTFISMTFICLMLFISICTLSGGLQLNKVLNRELKEVTPHNVCIYSYKGEDLLTPLIENKFNFNKYTDKYHYYNTFIDNLIYSDFLDSNSMEKNKNIFPIFNNQDIPIMKLTDFNKELEMLGEQPITLNKDQYAINSDVKDIFETVENTLKGKKTIKINNKILTPAKENVIEKTFNSGMVRNNICTIVVDDSLITNQKIYNSFLNFDYKNRDYSLEQDLSNDLDKVQSSVKDKEYFYITDTKIKSSSQGLSVSFAYLAIYLGIVFVITSAAVLAIQQLSESDDNIERYTLLKKIGVDNHIIYQSLFRQIGIYFIMPLLVAIIHSVVGLKISLNIVNLFGSGVKITDLISISGLFIIVVYGGYFLATYFGAKNIVKNKI